MSVSISGTKTVTLDAHPNLTAATLTTILAKAPEQLSVKELEQIHDAVKRVSGGGTPDTLIGALLT